MKTITLFLFIILSFFAIAQSSSKKVLFLGNSYTGANNLPQMIAGIAHSMGDTLIYNSNAPGGYTLQGHSSNASSIAKIAIGNWDFVVLQEQSQLPSFPNHQVEANVFPFARQLDSLINASNPCSETVFYMTWGRKNGDASNCANWPPVCTYAGMDSLLHLRYRMMAQNNAAILSPVGQVWKFIRTQNPTLELYQSDESHPSIAGTYAAACTFYTSLFRKNPLSITFNSTLSTMEAAIIKNAVKTVVYDSLIHWYIGTYDPIANFTFSIANGNEVSFSNNSSNATNFEWNFGDGTSSNLQNPTHQYTSAGTYNIQLIASKCGLNDTILQTITISNPTKIVGLKSKNTFNIIPNPAKSFMTISAETHLPIHYRILNLSGQEIDAGFLIDASQQININKLLEGVYLIELFNNQQIFGRQKFVKMDD